MAVDTYGLPQGIGVDGSRVQAVPRKVGAYDTEGIPVVASTVTNGFQLIYFQNATAFGQTLVAITSKLYGRDTNITSKTGGMAKGERLYSYGISAKADAMGQNLNTAAAAVFWDQVRRLWGCADVSLKLGSDEFIRTQARDIPVLCAKVPSSTFSDNLCSDISDNGMFDITINGQPYVLDQQEDFRIELTFNPGTAFTLTTETHITLRIEGVRLKAIRT
jgi:hypothetical protein